VVGAAARDAVVDEERQERRRHQRRVEALDDVVAAHLHVHEVPHLPREGVAQVVEAREAPRVAGGEPDLAPAARVQAVVERHLQHLGQVEVAGEVVVLLAEGADLDAAARPAAPRVRQRLPLPHQLLHDEIGIEDGGLPEPRPHDARRPVHEAVGVPLADQNRRARLQQPHLRHHVEEQECDVVHAVPSIRRQPAQADLREVGVGAALRRRHPHLGRRRLVVELDPQAVQQFLRLPGRQRPLGEAPPIERQEVLVEPPGAEGVPGVEFGGDAEVDEPVVLDRLPEVARRVGRHPRAHGGDALQLRASHAVRLAGGERQGPRRVPPGEGHEGLGALQHRLEFLLLAVRVPVRQDVERREAAPDVLAEVEHPLAVDLVVEDGVAGGALLHELREDARVVGRLPVVPHRAEEPLAHRAAAPVRGDLPLVDAARLGAHREGDLLPGIQEVEILQAVAAQLRIRRRRLGRRPLLADDQLPRADPHRLVFHQVPEGPGAQYGRRRRAFVPAIERRDQLGPLGGDGGVRIQAVLAQLAYPFGHHRPCPAFTRSPCPARSRVISAIR
jgi:hypothetical protein